ncbi:MAG: [Fe-Fe] hydrogenase large subunit C-terminal domain-containing protein [Bacillota bacterium]
MAGEREEMERIRRSVLVEVARQMLGGKLGDLEEAIRKAVSQCFPEGKVDRRGVEETIVRHLQTALRPRSGHSPVATVLKEACRRCAEEVTDCGASCPVGALGKDADGASRIDEEACIDCGLCINACYVGAIVERSEFLQVLGFIADRSRPAHAILAPSFVGQFGPGATPERIKATLLRLGFSEVYEVALAADVITVAEGREFLERWDAGESFMITSCCCPAFIKLVEKHRPRLAHLISPSVSPMIALGRLLKSRAEPDREPYVVFIGPCIAKKNEARLADLGHAVDCVLTYREANLLFEAANLDPSEPVVTAPWSDASRSGRNYAHTGGVTHAILEYIGVRRPGLVLETVKGNGLKQCQELLSEAERGTLHANFMEGMACPGGCVGGPGTVIPAEEGKAAVLAFAERSPFRGARDNPKAQHWSIHLAPHTDLTSGKDRPEHSAPLGRAPVQW